MSNVFHSWSRYLINRKAGSRSLDLCLAIFMLISVNKNEV